MVGGLSSFYGVESCVWGLVESLKDGVPLSSVIEFLECVVGCFSNGRCGTMCMGVS